MEEKSDAKKWWWWRWDRVKRIRMIETTNVNQIVKRLIKDGRIPYKSHIFVVKTINRFFDWVFEELWDWKRITISGKWEFFPNLKPKRIFKSNLTWRIFNDTRPSITARFKQNWVATNFLRWVFKQIKYKNDK